MTPREVRELRELPKRRKPDEAAPVGKDVKGPVESVAPDEADDLDNQ